MSKSEIPLEVRRFVLTSIPSVPHIEALMLMHATAPQKWSVPALAQRLYVSPTIAEGVLSDLCQAGIVQCDNSLPAYFLDQQSHQLGEVIERLALLYRTHLVEITLLIHSRLDRKAQQFADAFNLRKES